jgi:hypothetical protein
MHASGLTRPLKCKEVDTVADLWQQLLAAAVTHAVTNLHAALSLYKAPVILDDLQDLQNGRISIWTMPSVE